MAKEKCKECKRALVLDEENLCAYCELTQENGDEITLDVNCGICKVIVEEDSEGLFCDVCNSWFHNNCNERPLSYDLYALLNEAPNNIKWFCDKCIWETEKWIKELNSKHHPKLGGIRNLKKIINNLKESAKEIEVNKANEQGNYENNEDNEEVSEEIHQEDKKERSPAIPDIKVEIINEDLENEETHNSSDSDEWVPTEEVEEIIKIKQKKKRKNKTGEKIASDNIDAIPEKIETENVLNILDISPENVSNIADGIRYVKNPKHIRSKCNLCPKSFLHLEDCIAHKLRDHEGVKKPYKCPVCKITFDTKRHRERHMDKHSSEKKFSCDICGKTLKNNYSLQGHLKTIHSDEKPYSCTECDFTAKYKAALTLHMINEHSNETQFHCKICNKYFVSDCYLKDHQAVHSSEKPFSCEVCSKKFSKEKQRKAHMVRHATEKPFQCKECDKKYATRKLLKNHVLSHIPYEERPHVCDQCDLRFNNISNLRKHKEVHTGVLKAICDICGKGFRDTQSLKRHTMMHNDERPLKCEICGKGYRHSSQLSLHIKYHKKIVTARCPLCGYGAPTKNILDRHIKMVHTNETPYECDICGNKYKTKGNLSKHKRGIRGSCKGFNTADSSTQEKRESKASLREYYEQDESKHEESSIPFQETSIATARGMPTMQNHDTHPSLLLYTNSHNSNIYATQYHGSLIPPNSRGITAAIQTSPISY